MCNSESQRTYSVTFLIVHEGGNSPTLGGAMASLTMDMDGSLSNPKLVNGARNDTRSGAAIRRHE